MINAWMRYLSNLKNLSGIGLAVGAYTVCLFVRRHYAPVRTAFLANWSQRSHLRATGLERMCWTQSEAITLLKRIHRKKQQKGNIFMNTYLERAPYRIHRRHDWGGYKIYDEIFRIGIFETPQILLCHMHCDFCIERAWRFLKVRRPSWLISGAAEALSRLAVSSWHAASLG